MTNPTLQKITKWFREHFVFFGPGLLLALTAAGEAGVTEAIEIGAHHGLALIWVVLFTLIFKYAFTNGIARYTLATGSTIFDALGKIPGPKYWGSLLIIGVYLVEMFAIGAMLMFSALFLDYLLPGVYSFVLIAVFLLIIALAILRTGSYEILELIIAILVGLLSLAVIISLFEFPIPFNYFTEGLIPSIPPGSEMAILAIIGVVGSGLNLMLYSVWLNQKTKSHEKGNAECQILNETGFKRFIRSVNTDILIGFILVALITIGFMFLGFSGYAISFMGHGAHLTIDSLITQVLYIVGTLPYGAYGFLIFVTCIFFGAAVVGMDGRARAVSKVIRGIGEEQGRKMPSELRLYQIMLLVFSGVIILSFMIQDPLLIIRRIAAFSAIIFGIFSLIIIYLDFSLPKYARGSRLWLLVMGIGSIISIYVALLLESAFLTYGIPLIERLLVIAVILYVFSKTDLFKKFLGGRADLIDKFWVVILLSFIGIYGTIRGIPAEGILINFRDVGAMIAGVIGGPFFGGLVGFIAGFQRLLMGGDTALTCFAATFLAGVVAGTAIKYWNGKLTLFRALVLAVIVECIHLFVVLPATTIPSGIYNISQVLNIMSITTLPMILANACGMMIFAYIVRRCEHLYTGTFSMKRLIAEIKSIPKLLQKPDSEDDSMEEKDV